MQTMEFKAEVKELLNLVINSLYSHKEIFLRELVSNASDALDKARILSLTNEEASEGDTNWKIKIIPDKEAKTLTISDNGVGMDKEEIIEALGTIAHSGTRDFMDLLKSKDINTPAELIGQFGVGFYSAFMVADKVTVISRKAGQKDETGVKWESTADGAYTISDIEKPQKGTDVIVHLKNEDAKYLNEWDIREVIKKYSDFIEHPIVMDIEREKPSEIDKTKMVKTTEEETLNSRKALWLRSKDEITDDDYKEFYRHISHDFQDPLKIIHYKAEGTSEFSVLLYIPSRAPFNILYTEYKTGLMLYVKRVQIMENCEELLPQYLRFIKGVVDSSDLPLNVSRELLQNNRQVEMIKKNITKKVFDTLNEMKKEEYEKYVEFYKEFGRILKEGIHFDFSKKEEIANLLLLESTKTDAGKYTTLQNYIDNMKIDQEDIYFITGPNREEINKSPYLEALKEKDIEVLFMTDEIDDLIMTGFEFKGKKLKSVIKGEIKLDKSNEEQKEKAKVKFEKLIELIKDQLKDDVKDVRLSERLKDSAFCLVGDETDIDPRMEKMFMAMGQNMPIQKRIFEINPNHKLFEAMKSIFEKDNQSPILKDYIGLMYGQALLLEGSKLKDPSLFAKNITRLMEENAKQAI